MSHAIANASEPPAAPAAPSRSSKVRRARAILELVDRFELGPPLFRLLRATVDGHRGAARARAINAGPAEVARLEAVFVRRTGLSVEEAAARVLSACREPSVPTLARVR